MVTVSSTIFILMHSVKLY